jgi:kynurenine 3-monooxygenase
MGDAPHHAARHLEIMGDGTMDKTTLLRGRHFGIVGAGLVGSLAALHLTRHGARVTLIEKRPDLRRADIPGGRSIAMSLSHRGFRALATVGLEETVRAGTAPKTRRAVHLPDGSVGAQEYGRDGQALWTVNRKTLNCALLDGCTATGQVDIRFETTLDGVDLAAGVLEVTDARGRRETITCDHVIGADGMNSRVRGALCEAGVMDEDITTLDYRYFEMEIPPTPEGGFALDPDGVHIWPRPEGLFVALPNRGGTFTGTLFFAKATDNVFYEGREHADRVRDFVAAFTEVAALVPDHDAVIEAAPPSDIRAVRCHPWHLGERVCLIGDASHAIVPFFAMGMNTGFEDCTILDGLIEEFDGDVARIFPAFSERRKPCTDAILDLSLRNFVSIGKSADPDYDRRWRLERRLWDLMPDEWTPLYPMIHFGHRPLDEVIAVDARQKEILDALLAEFAEMPTDEVLLERARSLLTA